MGKNLFGCSFRNTSVTHFCILCSQIRRDTARRCSSYAHARMVLPYCLQYNIGVIVYSPMQSGLLTGAMTAERVRNLPQDDWRRNHPEFNKPRITRDLELVHLLSEIGKQHDVTPGVDAAPASRNSRNCWWSSSRSGRKKYQSYRLLPQPGRNSTNRGISARQSLVLLNKIYSCYACYRMLYSVVMWFNLWLHYFLRQEVVIWREASNASTVRNTASPTSIDTF